MFDNLNEVFNVSGEIIPAEEVEIVKSEIISDSDKIDNDYEYARTQLYSLIQKGHEAIDGILNIANASEHPRAYEVAFQGMKNLADINDKFMELHKKRKEISQESKSSPTTVNNALFVGTSAELQQFLKQSTINNTENKKSNGSSKKT
jgi:hypothetical protein